MTWSDFRAHYVPFLGPKEVSPSIANFTGHCGVREAARAQIFAECI
jgi:hypothetical protein